MADNSRNLKLQSETPATSREATGAENSSYDSNDTDAMEWRLQVATSTEKSSADDCQDSDEEEMEGRRQNAEKRHAVEELGHDADWRVRDAEKRRTHEALVQGIDHLFHEDDSPHEEGTSGDEPFRLPDRLSRLKMSSSSSSDQSHARDQSHVRDQSQVRDQSTPRRKPRRQTRRHREQRRNQEQAVSLFRAPARISLHGPLARTSDNIIYNKIIEELEYHHNRHPNADLFSAVKGRFELSRRDDMAVMSLIKGTAVARYLTGDTQQELTQYKQLKRDMHTCDLTNPGIMQALVYWQMCLNYMREGMPGSAHSAAQAAVSCIQHHTPSAWTSEVCRLQAYMYDGLAQVNPGHRREHQDVALRCFTQAREHYLHQPCQEEEGLYFPIYYTTEMINIKLEMPTIYTISGFPGSSDMVYHRLSECVVTQGQVTEAQDMLRAVSPHIHRVTAGYRPNINERVLICGIYLNIRLTQLAIIDKDYTSGLKYITTGAELYDDWSDIKSIYKFDPSIALYTKLPHLARDTKKVLDALHDRLALMLSTRRAPQPEPSSDSLSSEPSDAPPSGLKLLTDASRRAEKQARRDAYEFPYSSGDIHTGSRDDVSTDQN